MAYRYSNVLIITLIFLITDVLGIRRISFDMKIPEKYQETFISRYDNERCPEEDGVSYVNIGLTALPKSSITSKHIKSVCLLGNNFSTIPIEIFENAPNIECIDLSNNRVSKFFNTPLASTQNKLKQLLLNDQENPCNTRIGVLGEHFPNLEILHMNGFYQEWCSSDFSEFPNVRELYLGRNGLKDFSDIIRSIPSSLRILHLEDNYFHEIHSYNLKNLNELYLDGNRIESIYIQEESNLKILSVSQCNLQSSIGTLNMPNLEVLDLSLNELRYIKIQLFEFMPNLRQLSLRQNKLTEIPELQTLKELRDLSLGYNLIETVKEIPASSLETLILCGNKITDIEIDAFSQLSRLQKLDLSENRLKYLPPGWSNGLMSLKSLKLRNNFFSELGAMELTPLIGLTDLYVEDNVMKSVDENSLQALPIDCNIHVAYRKMLC